jgi:hypothetical protein
MLLSSASSSVSDILSISSNSFAIFVFTTGALCWIEFRWYEKFGILGLAGVLSWANDGPGIADAAGFGEGI